MDIKLNDEVIQREFNGAVDKAIGNAFNDYEVTSAIRESIAQEVIKGILATSMKSAIEQIDLKRITNSLAEELQKRTVSMVCHLIDESLVHIIYKLRYTSYMSNEEEKKAKELIYAELHK